MTAVPYVHGQGVLFSIEANVRAAVVTRRHRPSTRTVPTTVVNGGTRYKACRDCGRPLKTEQSQRRGRGPDCYAQHIARLEQPLVQSIHPSPTYL